MLSTDGAMLPVYGSPHACAHKCKGRLADTGPLWCDQHCNEHKACTRAQQNHAIPMVLLVTAERCYIILFAMFHLQFMCSGLAMRALRNLCILQINFFPATRRYFPEKKEERRFSGSGPLEPCSKTGRDGVLPGPGLR